jgi:hypothetical protein
MSIRSNKAHWWSYGEGILLRYKRRLSINLAQRRQYKHNFLGRRDPKYLEVAIVYNLYRTMGDLNVCVEFELLKVKVPIVFLGIEGFSPRRDGR